MMIAEGAMGREEIIKYKKRSPFYVVMEATQTFMGFQENMLKCFLVWRKCCQ
jgi:hypothetical protein